METFAHSFGTVSYCKTHFGYVICLEISKYQVTEDPLLWTLLSKKLHDKEDFLKKIWFRSVEIVGHDVHRLS